MEGDIVVRKVGDRISVTFTINGSSFKLSERSAELLARAMIEVTDKKEITLLHCKKT